MDGSAKRTINRENRDTTAFSPPRLPIGNPRSCRRDNHHRGCAQTGGRIVRRNRLGAARALAAKIRLAGAAAYGRTAVFRFHGRTRMERSPAACTQSSPDDDRAGRTFNRWEE
jgi:hypothetical protein